jgi:hypothetical protein
MISFEDKGRQGRVCTTVAAPMPNAQESASRAWPGAKSRLGLFQSTWHLSFALQSDGGLADGVRESD